MVTTPVYIHFRRKMLGSKELETESCIAHRHETKVAKIGVVFGCHNPHSVRRCDKPHLAVESRVLFAQFEM